MILNPHKLELHEFTKNCCRMIIGESDSRFLQQHLIAMLQGNSHALSDPDSGSGRSSGTSNNQQSSYPCFQSKAANGCISSEVNPNSYEQDELLLQGLIEIRIQQHLRKVRLWPLPSPSIERGDQKLIPSTEIEPAI